jgi:hypothetical protein
VTSSVGTECQRCTLRTHSKDGSPPNPTPDLRLLEATLSLPFLLKSYGKPVLACPPRGRSIHPHSWKLFPCLAALLQKGLGKGVGTPLWVPTLLVTNHPRCFYSYFWRECSGLEEVGMGVPPATNTGGWEPRSKACAPALSFSPLNQVWAWK